MNDDTFEVAVRMLKWLFTQTPELVIWLVGIVLAIVTWRKHAMASLCAVLGFGLLLLLPIPMLVFYHVVLPSLWNKLNINVELVSRSVAFGLSLIRAGAFGLLLFAIFYRRGLSEGGTEKKDGEHRRRGMEMGAELEPTP